MKLSRTLGLILVLACLKVVQAQSLPDTMWIYKNYLPDSLWQYFNIFLCDTNTFPNVGCFDTVDTGKEFDGPYINFNYQFTDTVENDTLGSEGPGYAAFKIYWDNGNTKYDATYYDSMVFWHVGPLAGHKVDLVWGQGGACGGPINYQYMGSFKSSATWTKTVLPFPRGFIRNGIFQLNVLIHDDSGTTSRTSAVGCLKLSDMGFIKMHSAPTEPVPLTPANGAGGQGTALHLTWTGGYLADSFSVVVAKDTGFNSTVFYQTGLTQTSVSVANLAQGTYYWHANATNPLGTTPWTATWNFDTESGSTSKNCGCGSGTGLALFPPIFFKVMRSRRRRKQNKAGPQ